MDTSTDIYSRYLRPAALLGGLLVFGLFTWSLMRSGHMQATQGAFTQLIATWSFGFVVLILWQPKNINQDHNVDDAMVLCRAIWCNLGVVLMASLVNHPARILLLVVPLFGIFYAALHLSRAQVLLVALITWLTYGFCNLGLVSYAQQDAELAALSGAGFALMLAGGLLLGWEVLRLRDKLIENNQDLQTTLARMAEMALTDELTGIHNRRHVLDVLERQKSLADRGQQSFTVCFCDLDHFKLVNDRYGHAVGDRALKQFAELALGAVRNVDYVARFGGEEFLLVLVGADENVASRVAHRLADHTREMWVKGTDHNFALTVSVGITSFRAGERIDDMLGRADRALYRAKLEGRDRVIVADRNAGQTRTVPIAQI